ncbi:MAG: hypothetical protein ACKVOT_06585 [Polaromonas sp.]
MSWFLAWARVLGLALALLLPQMLGLLHGMAHERAHPVTHAQADHDRTSSLASLFTSHEDGSPDCRLYDQASHDGLVTTVAALSLPLTIPGTGVALFAGDALARWAAQFDARGPPLTS